MQKAQTNIPEPTGGAFASYLGPDPAHLLESVFSRQRYPSLDTMGFRIYSDKVRVIGEIDLSHFCWLRFKRRLRFDA
jgi:hypothetical protein